MSNGQNIHNSFHAWQSIASNPNRRPIKMTAVAVPANSCPSRKPESVEILDNLDCYYHL